MRRFLRNKKGFTIVELLAVIVILGILIGISVPLVFKYVIKSTQQGYDTMARSAKEGVEAYLMDTPSTSGEIQIKDLLEDGFIEKPIDPDDSGYVCDGSVVYELVTADPDNAGGLDEYKYTVNLCCSEYEMAYEFPGGRTSTIRQADFCRIIRSTGHLPGYTGGDDDDTEVNPDAPTCSLRVNLTSGQEVNGAYTPDSNGNLELYVEMDITGDAVQMGLSTQKKSTNGKVSTKHNEGDGTFTYYGYVGSGGNYNSCELDIVVDTTPPTCPVITAYSNGSVILPETWTSNDIVFKFQFDSDAYRYEWLTNDGNDELVVHSDNLITDDASKQKTVSSAGERRIGLNVYDKYDNKSECLNDNNYYYIDKDEPSCVLSYVGTTGLNGWYNSSGELLMSVEDPGESGYQTGIVNDGSDTINSKDRLTISSDQNGVTYRGNVLSGTGAKGSCLLELNVDMTPPSINNLHVDFTSDYKERHLYANLSDNTSKIIAYAISTVDSEVMPSETVSVDNQNTFTLEHNIGFRAGTYYVWVRDAAGNVSKSSISVNDVICNISYDPDDGTVDMTSFPTTKYGGESFTLTAPTRDGWTFTGWTVSGNGASSDYLQINVGSSDVVVTATWEANFSDYVEFLGNNYASASSLQAYYVDGYNETTGTLESILRDIRYYGSNPNNYVKIGNEIWRAVGLINNGGNKIKLVRSSFLDEKKVWDNTYGVNSGSGVNEWSQSTISDFLSSQYISSSIFKYGVQSDALWNTTAIYRGTFTIEDYVAPEPEYDEDGNLIETEVCPGEECLVKDGSIYKFDRDAAISIDTAYLFERNKDHLGNQCIAGGAYCTDNVTRNATWNGSVGLIYPSDYVYASSNSACRTNIRTSGACSVDNWLDYGQSYWTITSAAFYNTNSLVMYVNANGSVDVSNASSALKVLPAVYLVKDATIVTGNGTSSDPYVLKALS